MHQSVSQTAASLGATALPPLYAAWAIGVLVAVSYCLLHALFLDGSPDASMTGRWVLSRFGAWPVLIPVAWALYRTLARHNRPVSAVASVALVALLGTALFTYGCWRWFGPGRSLAEAAYRVLPLTLAQLALLAATMVWLGTRSRDAIESERESDEPTLSVWKGTARTSISPHDIETVRAARNYVEILAHGQTYLRRDTLTGFGRRAGVDHLRPVHRCWLVNPGHVAGIHRQRGTMQLVMTSGLRVPVSRTYRRAVADWATQLGISASCPMSPSDNAHPLRDD